ncbi:geraniol dehydrogenase [Podospora aff. communis PSN243]|uniref:Geraniol dehydrogenase n=1 Tax=Podospora aff. communis PSN243 TaxID=3040156 RepID=A0AAV9G7M6_9PEZI|nr:geraniol dehydrogenase [Podospora aff. communis PSN243]
MNSTSIQTEAYIALSPSDPITLSPVTYPTPIRPDEILLATSAVSICATDLKATAGKFLTVPPLILGHEAAGTILQVGSAVSSLRPGDKVILSYASCHECRECQSGGNAYCERIWELNFSGGREGDGGVGAATILRDGEEVRVKTHFFGQSSMGRLVIARAVCAVKVDGNTTEEEMRMFASLGCGIQTGAGVIMNVARPESGRRILVFGAGAVGLAACLAAALTEPEVLVLVDNSGTKLGVLPGCVRGVVAEMVNSEGVEEGVLVERLKGLTADGLGFDVAVDCVGRGDVVRVAHLALRARGMVVTVGGSKDVALQVTLSEHLGRGITYRGTHQGDSVPSQMIPHLIGLWRQGKFPFDKLLTFFEFDELHQAVQGVKEGKVIKPVLINRNIPSS